MARTTELEHAIKILTKCYENEKRLAFVQNPLAWALYQTWKYFDRKKNDE